MPIIPHKKRALAAASKLHAQGYWVVPCNGKKATKKNWPNERVELKELEKDLQANRDLNIAIVLSQCDLIDVEFDNGDEGKASLLQTFGGELPETPTWASPRGEHRLFVRPDGLPKKAKIDIEGIEFRVGNGKGALSVLPPSQGRKWFSGLSLDEVQPAALPEQIVEKLRASAPKPTDSGDTGEKIPEGKRNDALFQKACALQQVGLPEETIAEALLSENQRLCDPPLAENEVRAIAHSAASGDKPKIGFLSRLLGDIELWHDDNDDPFATLPQGEHRENWKIGKRVRSFRRWLSKLHYEATGRTIGDSDLAEICSLLEGMAIFDGPKYKVWRRVAEHNDNFYLDLCDDAWRAVEIDCKGWRVISDPPVKFFRARAMLSLPMPERPKTGEDLKSLLSPFLNLDRSGLSWPLVAGWLVAAIRPRGPYPVLKLLGEQGTAKTTTARVLRQLIDPNAASVRAEPRSTRDLMIAANNAWALCLDNLSSVKSALSDALCRLSTGGGFATRTLYTDEEETIFEATRPVILTSIEEIGTRSDLLERSLIIELPTIVESERRAEKEFWAAFEKLRPRILGALLDVVSDAINRLPVIEQASNAELSRLADFEQWVTAAEIALGLNDGEFSEAYRANREAATHIVLESSAVVSTLLKYVKKNSPVELTATELLDKLNLMAYDKKNERGWPKNARALSGILKRVAPNLRQVGITAVKASVGTGNEKRNVWRICAPRKTEESDKGADDSKNTKSDFANHVEKKRAG